jgi:hypothetical protein
MTYYFNSYQLKAGQNAIFPGAGDVESMTGLSYVAMGLASGAGEILGKVKRILHDSGGLITDEHRDALSAELGEVLRYAALLATQLDIGLAMVANQGLAKLATRTT